MLLTFFGFATSSLLYANLPALASSNRPFLRRKPGFGELQERADNGFCAVCSEKFEDTLAESRQFQGMGKQCLTCYMESLPRLCAERGFLSSEEMGSPLSPAVADAGGFRVKARETASTSRPSAQPSGVSAGLDRKRLEAPQIIEVHFDGSLPGAAETSPRGVSSGSIFFGPKSFTKADKTAKEGTHRPSTRSSPVTPREEKAKGDVMMQQEETEVIIDNAYTRTIVVGAAWAPGRQGLPPYAAVKAESLGSFEIVLDPSQYSHMFRLEPSKGSLFPGSRQVVRAVFSPQAITRSETHRILLVVTT